MSQDAVLITGATGLVGRALLERLAADGQTLICISRDPQRVPSDLRSLGGNWIAWDRPAALQSALRASGAIVHLAGEPVFAGRLTAARRKNILGSRVKTTQQLVQAMRELPEPERPHRLLCASAVGIYGNRGEEELPESAASAQGGFLAEVCRHWEEAALSAENLGVQVCILRLGIVLSLRGGALPRMALPFRLGLGGPLGRGRAWVPWVHLEDLVGMIAWLLESQAPSGIFNAVAPHPVRNIELTRALGRALHRPTFLPVPPLALHLALGELSAELLDSRKVLPARALQEGFDFSKGKIEDALAWEFSS